MILLKNDSEFLEIIILKRMHPNAADFWDANWLEAEITIEVSGFKGHYLTNLRVEDFQRFYKQINELQNTTINEALFTTIETGLSLMCTIQKTGTLTCKGQARHELGNNLNFAIFFDNNVLTKLTIQLEKILISYPIIGAF